jgi:hypothetical protein
MELLDKNQTETLLGKFSAWSRTPANSLFNKIEYIGGADVLDKLFEDNLLKQGSVSVILEIKPNGLEISLSQGFKTYRTGILSVNLNYWSIENQKEIIATKSKSIVGRALLGGVLFGPVGAIVGGLTGIGNKEIKGNEIDNILSLSIIENDKELMMLFSCKDKHLKSVMEFMRKSYSNIYKSASDIKADEATRSFQASSPADEIKKWKDLLEMGAISNNEFEMQKSKILNK